MSETRSVWPQKPLDRMSTTVWRPVPKRRHILRREDDQPQQNVSRELFIESLNAVNWNDRVIKEMRVKICGYLKAFRISPERRITLSSDDSDL